MCVCVCVCVGVGVRGGVEISPHEGGKCLVFYISLSLSHSNSFGDSLCAGETDSLTLSATVTTLAGEMLLQQRGLLHMC